MTSTTPYPWTRTYQDGCLRAVERPTDTQMMFADSVLQMVVCGQQAWMKLKLQALKRQQGLLHPEAANQRRGLTASESSGRASNGSAGARFSQQQQELANGSSCERAVANSLVASLGYPTLEGSRDL